MHFHIISLRNIGGAQHFRNLDDIQDLEHNLMIYLFTVDWKFEKVKKKLIGTESTKFTFFLQGLSYQYCQF